MLRSALAVPNPNCMQAYTGTVLLQDTHQQGVTGQHSHTNDSVSAKLFAADFEQHYLQSIMLVATPCSVPTQALGSLKCKRRILLSGTPVQNNLDEVSLFAARLAEMVLATLKMLLFLRVSAACAGSQDLLSAVVADSCHAHGMYSHSHGCTFKHFVTAVLCHGKLLQSQSV